MLVVLVFVLRGKGGGSVVANASAVEALIGDPKVVTAARF